MHNFGKDNRPHLPVRVGRAPVSMLIDTGAKFSCISDSCLAAIETINATKFRRTPARTTLVGANKSVLDCAELAHLPLRLPHTAIQWPVFIVKDLGADLLAGVDMLARLGAAVNASSGKVTFSTHAQKEEKIMLIATSDVAIDPCSTATVKVRAAGVTSNQSTPSITGIADSQYGTLIPGIISTDANGGSTVAFLNCTTMRAKVSKGDVVGCLDKVEAKEETWLTEQQTAAAICPVQEPPPQPPPPPLSQRHVQERRRRLAECLHIECPPQLRQQYEQLLLEFQDVFSLDDNDLGFTNAYEHKIELTSTNPVHVKQFRVPLAQQQFINDRVKELAKLKVIEPSTSPYNTPMFAVPKKTKPGEPPAYRLIQDLRQLNKLTKTDKHSICDVRTCLDRIGELKAKVFSSIDLRSGYHQMGLAKESRPYTAFTLPLLGQWQWRVTTMGLTGAPASFSKLMEKVMQGLDFILRYLDDLLAASSDHQQHLQHLRAALERLRKFNLKINPQKSTFGAPKVEYLGHSVSGEGFTIGEHKFHAIKEFPPPVTKKKVQQFLGLANFFRQLIPNFQKHAGHLSALLTTDNAWKMGPLPPKAAEAFHTLKNALLTKPVVAFPRPDHPFTLATDAALGDPNTPGGLGAVLTQTVDGHPRVIAYASRALKQHEKTQSAFQLELQAVVWALEHFGPYLRHSTFEVVTDHRPVANLSQQQLKSLHRLHEKMLEFPCVIKYRPGVLNDVADALSRNAINAVSVAVPDIQALQQSDPLCARIRRIRNGDMAEARQRPDLEAISDKFKEAGGFLMYSDPEGEYDGYRIVVPAAARKTVLEAAHAHKLAGHVGRDKTFASIKTKYWWPTLYADVDNFVKTCEVCQKAKDPWDFNKKRPLHPLQPPEAPNDRVHVDLFGPLPESACKNKWILTITCAFSRFVRVVPLPNKETRTVAEAILRHWIAVFGPMKKLVHDQGREFHSELLNHLLKSLGIEQRTTSAMAPAVNGQAEVFNKWIAAYIKKMSNDAKGDWEGHLAPLNLAYNSAIHSAHNRQPAAVMFGRSFKLPHLQPPRGQLPQQHQHPWAQQQQQLLRKTWQDVHQRLHHAGAAMQQQQLHQGTRTFVPLQGERVLLYYPRTALAAKGPPKLQQQWKEAVILAQLAPATFLVRPRWTGQRETIAHANRIKAFFPRIVLPRRHWCVDPRGQENEIAQMAASCPSYCPCRSAQQQGETKKKKKKPDLGHEGTRKKKKGRKNQDVGHQTSGQDPFLFRQPQEQQRKPIFIDYVPLTPGQRHWWLRSSPAGSPHANLRTSANNSSLFYSAEAENLFTTPESSSPELYSPPDTRTTGRSPSFRFPRPRPRSTLPRALQRLSTKLTGWRNVVLSSSSSGSGSTEASDDPDTTIVSAPTEGGQPAAQPASSRRRDPQPATSTPARPAGPPHPPAAPAQQQQQQQQQQRPDSPQPGPSTQR